MSSLFVEVIVVKTIVLQMIALSVFVLVAACDEDTAGDGLPDAVDCSSCHGRDGDPAPPPSLEGAVLRVFPCSPRAAGPVSARPHS